MVFVSNLFAKLFRLTSFFKKSFDFSKASNFFNKTFSVLDEILIVNLGWTSPVSVGISSLVFVAFLGSFLGSSVGLMISLISSTGIFSTFLSIMISKSSFVEVSVSFSGIIVVCLSSIKGCVLLLISLSFFLNNWKVNFSRSYATISTQIHINKSLVMSQI